MLATLIVNTATDVVNPTDGTLSLRDAITAVDAGKANGLTAGEQNQVSGTFGVNDMIEFSAALSGDTVTLNGSALPTITASLTITGLGANDLTISGNHQSQVFLVASNTTVSIAGLTIQDGNSGDNGGGGIYSAGNLTVSNSTLADNATLSNQGGGIGNFFGTLTVNTCTLTDNSAVAGGGIENYGTLMVTNSSLTGNTAVDGGFGGGIENGSTLTLSDSVLSGNSASFFGGGIYNAGALTVSNSIVSDNSGGVSGGGIFNVSTLMVSNANLEGNSAVEDGGGIFNDAGTVTVSNATLLENVAYDSDGGGIYNSDLSTLSVNTVTLQGNYTENGNGGGIANFGALTVNNSTLNANAAEFGGDGGGIYNGDGTMTVNTSTLAGNFVSGQGALGGGIYIEAPGGTLTVTGSTLAGNSADEQGGGLYNNSASLPSLNDSIVAENTAASDPDAVGFVFGNYNIVGDGNGLSGQDRIANGSNGNLVGLTGSQVGLAPLENYGGPTQTMALLPGSLAIADGDPTNSSPDQRGVPVQNGIRDIGAFESQGFTIAVARGNNQDATVGTSFAAPLTVTVTPNSSFEPVDDGVVTFTAPGSGASATLPADTATISGGLASVMAAANNTAGSYNVAATAAGVSTPAAFALTNNLSAPPGTFVVTSTADSGTGSLRQAILSADAYSGTATITFDIPASDPGYNASTGSWTITPLSALPTLSEAVVLDATTQPGYTTDPVIQLDGVDAGANVNGLTITGGNGLVQGLDIGGFSGYGMELTIDFFGNKE